MEPKAFEFKIGQRQLSVEMGKMVCVLFRRQQEVDYLAINTEDQDEDSVLRIFNNVELVRWLAGFAFSPDGIGLTTEDGKTFQDRFGWWPPTIVKQTPSEAELEWFLDVNARDIDKEWDEQA